MNLEDVWQWMKGSSLDIPDCIKKTVREAAEQLYKEEGLNVNDPECIFYPDLPEDMPTERIL